MYKIYKILEVVDHLLTLFPSSAKWHSINSSLLVNLISSVSLRCLRDSSSLFVPIFQNSSCFTVLSILNYLFLIEKVVKNGMGKAVEENYFIWKDTKLPVAGVTWSCYYNRRSPPDGIKIHKTQVTVPELPVNQSERYISSYVANNKTSHNYIWGKTCFAEDK